MKLILRIPILNWRISIFSGLLSDAKRADVFDTYYKRLMPVYFGYKDWLKPEEMDETSDKLRKYYFEDKKIGLETARDLTNVRTYSYLWFY